MTQLKRVHFRHNKNKCFRTLCFLDKQEFQRWLEFNSTKPLVAQFWQRRQVKVLIYIPVSDNAWMITEKSKVSIRYVHHYATTI